MKYVPFLIQLGVVAVAAPFALSRCNLADPKVVWSNEPLDPVQGKESAVTTSAPVVPRPVARSYATRVVVDLEIKEHVKALADGVTYAYWTFGDDAPGPFLRVREGDLVEVHLHNHPDNSLAHSINFQAATGPGGGGEASHVAPGHSAVFTWRALRPGLYLYNCMTAPAGLHIANGLFGQILVEPKQGLPEVDHEYQIVQSEFYTEGKFGETGPQRFSLEKALKEEPEYVVFNGRVGALLGDKALKAKVGDKIRVYLGNAGPNLVSSFHVIGEIFDAVYQEGGVVPNQRNVQTTAIPAGGSAIVEFTVEVPGEYAFVDHSMFRAFNKGTMGQLKVEGKDNQMIFSGRTAASLYTPGTRLAKVVDFGLPSKGEVGSGAQDGATIFATVCAACHQADGKGLPGAFPPLRRSDFLMDDKERSIRILLAGLKGEIRVNGASFNSEMPKPPLNDAQIAAVLSYVRTNLDNQGDAVTEQEVAAVREGWDGKSPLVADPAWLSGPKGR
ncbi:MAG TPA: copper-containing nitrite reductase [Polyangiaceae bacterium]|jgi:nitrite reductase (NO-forming)